VISSVSGALMRTGAYAHLVDRACAGRCFSYANYEPSSWAFRLRAEAENPAVLYDPRDLAAFEESRYVVRPRDLPLYQLYNCGPGSGGVCVRQLRAGDTVGLPQ
jgi:hypothetical protein